MYNIFIHLSVDGHFHILAIVNSAAMNIGVHVSFELVGFLVFLFYLAIYPGVELVDHLVVLFLGF